MRVKKYIPTPVDLLKGELKAKRVSAPAIAQSLGLTKWAVYKVRDGKAKTPAVREAIAKALGKKPAEIWKDYVPASLKPKARKALLHAI